MPVCAIFAALGIPAQTSAVIPAPLGNALPGNAAVSAPLRWERGVIQVIYRRSVLPSGFGAGSVVTGITLRRPAFVDEPAYSAVTRSLRVWMSSTSLGTVGPNTRGNYAGTPVEVLPLTTVQIPATQPTRPGDAVGDDLVFLSFTTPFTMGALPHLMLQIEMHGGTFAVANDNWIDAVWFPMGVDEGYATHVGNGGCAAVPGVTSRLTWTGPRIAGRRHLGVGAGVGTGATYAGVLRHPTQPAGAAYVGAVAVRCLAGAVRCRGLFPVG